MDFFSSPRLSFTSDGEALEYYRSLARSLHSDLDDTKLALDEFQVSSKELETELEKELQATEKQLKELRGKEEHLLHEIEQWKVHSISLLTNMDCFLSPISTLSS